MSDDQVTAELEYLGAALHAARTSPESFDLDGLLDRFGRVIEALSVARGHHRRSLFPASNGPDRGKHYCFGCTKDVDHHMLYVPWPCPEMRAITTALFGKEGTDGG